MIVVYGALMAVGWYPFFRAWQSNRQSTLVHAVIWAAAAWMSWGIAFLFGNPEQSGFDTWRYVALCLTCAAGVTVLGARRPNVGAWNAVVLGLLLVFLLPLGEHLILGTEPISGLRTLFLAATLIVVTANYLATALALPAIVLGLLGLGELITLDRSGVPEDVLSLLHVGLLTVPLLAMALWPAEDKSASEVDRAWRHFRDRYGVFWAQRMRGQFNRAAAGAGLPGSLQWRGWQPNAGLILTEERDSAALAILTALLKRFENTAEFPPI